MLELSEVGARYGQFQALRSVSLTVNKGEVVALLGANAAGKSTTLKCISRLVLHSAGSIRYEGNDIRNWSSKRLVQSGVVLVPEGRQVFPFLTVRENLDLGSYLPEARRRRRESLDQVYEWMPILSERASQLGGTLSGGEQQLLAIGRAIMANPRVLMLDEPSLGLSPVAVQRVFDLLAKFKALGMTLLLVEQNVVQALRIADRAYVLHAGATVLEGTAAELADNPTVREAYLGSAFDTQSPALNLERPQGGIS
jgi:branched-chain amino acid transport system ATP-binding protein